MRSSSMVVTLSLILALMAGSATAQVVFTFDNDEEGFFIGGTAGAMTIGQENGHLKVTGGDGDTSDPQVVSPADLNFSADDNQEFAVKFSVSGLEADYSCGVFVFPTAGGHRRNQFSYGNGDNQVKRLNYTTGAPDGVEVQNGDFTGEIGYFRMDFPEENTGWDDGDAVLLIDWVAWSNDPNFEPAGGEGEGEGEGEGDVVFRFDCDTEGWAETHNVSVDHMLGWLIVKPTGADPYTQVGVSVAGNTLTEFGAVMEVQNAPDANPIACAMFWFADGGHGRAPFSLNDGANVVRFNVPDTKESGAASWDDSVSAVRLDLPDADPTPLMNADTTFLIDALAFSAADDFVPDPWTLDNDCDNDGLSNDAEATLGTDPQDADTDGDGVKDGIEVQHGSDPLDPQDTVEVPVMTWAGLAFTALLLAAAALVVASRRRSMSY